MAESWKTEVEGFKEILTATAPGAWAGKEGKHIPTVSIADGKVTVAVPHGMADDHWINYIWCKADDKIIAITKLTPTDKPELIFEPPEGTKEFVAYESCNLHGVWATDPIKL